MVVFLHGHLTERQPQRRIFVPAYLPDPAVDKRKQRSKQHGPAAATTTTMIANATTVTAGSSSSSSSSSNGNGNGNNTTTTITTTIPGYNYGLQSNSRTPTGPADHNGRSKLPANTSRVGSHATAGTATANGFPNHTYSTPPVSYPTQSYPLDSIS
ncbi:hypothetical protein EV182_000212 [Spiromyces aspiralis]|uniref:Uncharacterized protein n=1 Tax=Spiromyces aspiralis TaxID=68401 RepID=A0ACC1HHC8_9FUNG|nr:hypothetical protein EV182_000212 [Spiromyces aspiralis]